ncbi:GAF domain-containing sensor histidine kinase [Candidatus Saccharibacteria bacterium]|nr:GAF domain-containing sensor histidine kinase [Candidatus Saccharibacteria bacterium]
MAVVLAFSFQPLRKFFNKWTNRFFYQDAYDSQTLLDNLNNVLVSTMDLNKMLRASADVLSADIKPEYCAFGLKETDTKKQRIIGDLPMRPNASDVKLARLHTPKLDHKVVVADALDDTDKELQAGMRANGVAVLVRLTNDVDAEGVGYIILGTKKSGNPYNPQDIRVLEIVANSMIIAIENALRFEEIQNFNTHLKDEIEQATKKLQRANDKLIALDQTKDDFISMASHQLRTPLTSVKGYLSMVLEGDAGKINDDQRELLSQAFISSQRMVYLIADLLNLSRLKTGKFIIEATPLNLADIVDSEIAQIKETALARGLKLVYHKPKDFPVLMMDETKIRQVMTNFIDNAIYYTPKGGQIDVVLKDGRQSVEFTVTDNGIGVPRKEQHNLFSKFFRADNAKKARPDGTGLGLFMAKKVIVAQGGAIVFRSTEGKGSTFGFTFLKSRLKVK